MKKILVLNTGSSTLKYQLFEVEGNEYNVVAKGNAERIGIENSFVSIKIGNNDKIVKNIDFPSHNEAIKEVFALLLDGAISDLKELDAVGHRVVHGGEYFNKSVVINSDVMEKVKELCSLAPLHNPAGIMGINAVTSILPNIKQVAVFDTAFHQTMPKESFLYALPLEQYEENKIRRYGFHGTSHLYVSEKATKLIGGKGNIITCHLGSGASISAVKDGKCYDTSMGLTPLEGVVMGTRCGSIDPYIPLHLMKSQGLSIDEVNDLMNKKSGMLGLTGFSDMRDVEDRYFAGEQKAIDGMNVYIQNILRCIGSYIAVMGGVDAIVFTAGVGENAPIVRKIVCERLSYLGITINEEANNKRGDDVEISNLGSKVRVFVLPTNEELVIAQDTVNLM